MKTIKSKNTMVWLDMEMTGLDPRKEKIIEIATILTDGHLHVIAEGPDLVIRQNTPILRAMDSWNKRQHRQSGLLDQVRKSKISVKQAEDQTLRFLKKYCYAGKSPLCGNSIHHDRTFLVKYMPRLHRFLHYRHVDVSSVKELIFRWYPRKKHRLKKKETHRAMADIRDSIAELRDYRKRYFRRASGSGF